jgi:hypothetical protein
MAAVIPAATQGRLAPRDSEGPQIARVRRSPPDRRNHLSRQRLLQRVQAEFDDLRGLNLTFAQARRLFGLRDDVCARVLNALMREGLLQLGADDRYARSDIFRTSMAGDGF